jgi:parallel beta-helix repeat protein
MVKLIGEDKNTTIIDGGDILSWTDTVWVLADCVTIKGFTIQSSAEYGGNIGILLLSHHNTIQDNIIKNHAYSGIFLGKILWDPFSSNDNYISENIITDNIYGIYGIGSSNVITKNRIIKATEMWPDGICLAGSFNVISENIIENFHYAIYTRGVSNIITGNTIKNNYASDIFIESSSNTIVTNNSLGSGGISITGELLSHWNTHTIENNTVNGKPLRYYMNSNGIDISNETSQLILANCSNSIIHNLSLSEVYNGIQIGFSFHINITRNTLTNTFCGINLYNSSSISINENIIKNNSRGIQTERSHYNTILNNTISYNTEGCVFSGWYNTISDNIIAHNQPYSGLFISGSYNIVTQNSVDHNKEMGLHVKGSNNTIGCNKVLDSNDGIRLDGSNNTITMNNVTSSRYGIFLDYNSNSNIITYNILAGNQIYGIFLRGDYAYGWCKNNKIYHNNFMNNTYHAIDFNSYNFWDNGYPSGGNYWDDYTGVDQYSGPEQNEPYPDGIGDTPYDIPEGENHDRYPYMNLNGWPLNHPPYVPHNPHPENGMINVDRDTDISWIGGDLDPEDIVTYDIYFEQGDSTPDVLVSDNQSGTFYDPGTLAYNSTYYWKIVAWDTRGDSSEGPIWMFTSESEPDSAPPLVQITKPVKAIYCNNKKLFPFVITIIIKNIDIKVNATDEISGVNKVEFYIDGLLKETDTIAPYNWTWDIRTPLDFRHTIKVVVTDNTMANKASEEIIVWKFF